MNDQECVVGQCWGGVRKTRMLSGLPSIIHLRVVPSLHHHAPVLPPKIFMDASVTDSSQVVIDTGCGVLVELPVKEAMVFINKKVSMAHFNSTIYFFLPLSPLDHLPCPALVGLATPSSYLFELL